MYIVTVNFEVKPDHVEDFMVAMMANARASVETEPGCHQFDVCFNKDKPESVFLYEVYADRAAFDAHLATKHFATVEAETGNLVRSKSVTTFDTLQR